MSLQRILFVDRDGTLIEEPSDQQVDRIDKVALVPGVIAALQRIVASGFELVMVSNQAGSARRHSRKPTSMHRSASCSIFWLRRASRSANC